MLWSGRRNTKNVEIQGTQRGPGKGLGGKGNSGASCLWNTGGSDPQNWRSDHSKYQTKYQIYQSKREQFQEQQRFCAEPSSSHCQRNSVNIICWGLFSDILMDLGCFIVGSGSYAHLSLASFLTTNVQLVVSCWIWDGTLHAWLGAFGLNICGMHFFLWPTYSCMGFDHLNGVAVIAQDMLLPLSWLLRTFFIQWRCFGIATFLVTSLSLPFACRIPRYL